MRHVLERAGISAAGTKILLENVNVHNGEIFSLKVRELEGLGLPVDDIRKVAGVSSQPAAAGGVHDFHCPTMGSILGT